jgi:hypothetical protein
VLEALTVDTFAPRIGETFRIDLPDGAIALQLVAADLLGEPAGEGGAARAPFSIVFRGPHEVLLPQRTYRLEHDDLAALEIFLVPIGPDEDGLRYEAVFS